MTDCAYSLSEACTWVSRLVGGTRNMAHAGRVVPPSVSSGLILQTPQRSDEDRQLQYQNDAACVCVCVCVREDWWLVVQLL